MPTAPTAPTHDVSAPDEFPARDLAAALDGDDAAMLRDSGSVRQHLRGFWALVLAGAVLCATALFVVLFKLPSGGAIEHAAAISTALAERVAAPAVGKPALDAEITRRIDLLDHALQADDLDRSLLAEFATAWQAARQRGQDEELRELLPSAQTLTTSIRAGLDARHERLEGTIKIVTATLAGLLLLMIFGLLQHRRRLRRSLHRFSDELEQGGDWQDAVQALRADPAGPQSTFDAIAAGVSGVLHESERRWQALAELSADWYWETDRQHRLVKVSGSIEVFTAQGWAAEDLSGRRFDQLSFFKAPGASAWTPLMDNLQQQNKFRDFECSVISRDKRSMRWVALSGRPRLNEQGQFLGFEGVARDVTERRRTVAKLKASEQRWSTVVRLATDWYWESDEQHRVQPMLVEQQQHPGPFFADAVRGRTLWEAFPFGLDVMAWEMHRLDLQHHRPFRELELCVDRDDGSRLWLAISGIPRFNAAGGFRGYHGVARDITGHKEAERVLLRHNEELQRAVQARTHELQVINRDLEAFARQLAHELRTPIGHIQGLAQLLLGRSAELKDEDRQLLELQLQSAGTMRETVDALLNLARSTMQPMPTEVVDVSAMAQEVVDGLTPLQRVAPVQWQIQPGLRAVASSAALKIVLTNLLSNAARFTRRCELPQVLVSGRTEDDGAMRITVEDNGVGFDPAKAERLFKPFGRLHTDEDYTGTGIGLTIVLRIVERHGGRVQAEARSEGGARFSFTLPAQLPNSLALPEEITA